MHHIMFDIDGTLVESLEFDEDYYLDAVQKTLGHEMNNDWTKYQHITDAGILDQHLQNKGLLNQRDKIHADVKKAFINNIKKHLVTYPVEPVAGAIKFLEKLKIMSNVSLSIATGGWGETALMKLNSAGFNVSDIPLASSNDHYSRTEIMKIALKKSNASDKEKTSYFGDAWWDKKACEELDINFVLVGNQIDHSQTIDDFTSIDKAFSFIGLSNQC